MELAVATSTESMISAAWPSTRVELPTVELEPRPPLAPVSCNRWHCACCSFFAAPAIAHLLRAMASTGLRQFVITNVQTTSGYPDYFVIERAKALYDEVDTDKSGLVSHLELFRKLKADSELEDLLNISDVEGKGVSGRIKMMSILSKLDQDGDKQITWQEFESALEVPPPAVAPGLEPHQALR